jgi:hypothetical protein
MPYATNDGGTMTSHIAYMCKTDFDHELLNGAVYVYPSIEDLRASRSCTAECGIVEISVSLVRVIQSSDFKQA